jgi:hypothetical protein
MSTNTPAATVKKEQKSSALKKDVICLALVVLAVFILHAFSRSAIEQLYKAKEKTNTGVGVSAQSVTVF